MTPFEHHFNTNLIPQVEAVLKGTELVVEIKGRAVVFVEKGVEEAERAYDERGQNFVLNTYFPAFFVVHRSIW
jgi:hypothetical protein